MTVRNCTRLNYYVWHWDTNPFSVLPCKFKNNPKAAMQMMKRFPLDSGHFKRHRSNVHTQMDMRGVAHCRDVAVCWCYWENGKIIKQELKYA
jgi:hypothetical protein